MLNAVVWQWKVAPSIGFLQCTITVLITRGSSSFYPSSSHPSTVGCRAVYAEHPLLQPRDNWHPLCLQAERETRVGEWERRKEWEKLESGRERVPRGPIVRSGSRVSFSPCTNKHFHASKPDGDSRCDFYDQTAGGAPGMSYQLRAEGHRSPGNLSPVIDMAIPLNGPGLVREDGEEENVGKRQGWKRRMKEDWEWVCYELACFEQWEKCMIKQKPCVLLPDGSVFVEIFVVLL